MEKHHTMVDPGMRYTTAEAAVFLGLGRRRNRSSENAKEHLSETERLSRPVRRLIKVGALRAERDDLSADSGPYLVAGHEIIRYLAERERGAEARRVRNAASWPNPALATSPTAGEREGGSGLSDPPRTVLHLLDEED